jgi:biotin transport system permease protein
MAGRLTFHFYPGNSPLHNWDARCKFFGLLSLAIGLMYMNSAGLVFFSVLFAVALLISRIPIKALAEEMRMWAWFLLIIFAFQVFSFTGNSVNPAPNWWPSGYDNVFASLLHIWQLGLILCYAMLFSMVTRPRELQETVMWLLRPFPFLPARRIGLMVSLMLRFLPLILDQAEEVQFATRARLGNQRRNPVLRMKYFVLPLFRRSIKRADDLANALVARGYRDDLPISYSSLPMKHLAGLAPLSLMIVLWAGWIPHSISGAWHNFMRFALGTLS